MPRKKSRPATAVSIEDELAVLKTKERKLQARIDALEHFLQEAPRLKKEEDELMRATQLHNVPRKSPPPAAKPQAAPAQKERLSVQIPEEGLEQLRRETQRTYSLRLIIALGVFAALIIWLWVASQAAG